jgi:hypothetical protein
MLDAGEHRQHRDRHAVYGHLALQKLRHLIGDWDSQGKHAASGDDPADEVVERRVVTVLGDDRFEVGRTRDLEVVERIGHGPPPWDEMRCVVML